MVSFKPRRRLLFAACALPAFAGAAAYAQEDNTADTIVVFAQKREQRLQDVPVSVAVFNAQILEDAGVRDIKELATLTPGLTVTSTTNETVTTARIRGIGTVGDNPGLESSVGIVIDNVYRPRNGVGFGDLGEIERIEVLKGPQGTLFGKNTSAGVIQVFSKAPEWDWGGNAEVTVGEYGTMGVAGALTGPIVEDQMAFRLYGAKRVREGFWDVRTGEGPRTDREDNDQDMYTVRGQLLWTPTPNVDFKLIADITERDEHCCVATTINAENYALNASVPVVAGLVNALATDEGIVFPPNTFARLAYANRGTRQKVEDRGVSGEIGWDFGPAELTSVTAWRKWDSEQGIDIDYTSADMRYAPDDGSHNAAFDTFSQEIRLAGEADFGMGLNWLVGLFYAKEDLSNDQHLLVGADYFTYWGTLLGAQGLPPATVGIAPGAAWQPGTGLYDFHDQEDTTWAIFTNNSLTITEQLELTIGLRFTHDEKDLVSDYNTTGASCQIALMPANQAAAIAAYGGGMAGVAGAGPRLAGYCLPFENDQFNNTISQSREDDEWTGTAKLAYRWTPDVMTYASYSRGFKAGGFNLDREQVFGFNGTLGAFQVVRDDDTAFDGEFVDSYEIGTKTTWMGGDLLLNLTAFLQQYENFQLNTFVGTNFIVTSIPEVESKGAEAEFLWRTPVDGLNFQGGVTYAETKYGDSPPLIPTMNSADGSISDQPNLSLVLLPGNTVSFAPEWSVSAGFGYETLIFSDSLRFRTSLNGRWVSDYSTASDLLPGKDQDSFAILNGRIGVGGPDERWTAELFATNLTDEDYIQVGFNTPQIGSTSAALTAAGYNPANDSQIYSAFLGAPRVIGASLKFRY